MPYDESIALETIVEREPVPLDLAMRALVGRHFVKLVARETATDLRPFYLPEFGIVEPTAPLAVAQLRSDQPAWQLMRAVAGRVIDGGRLLAAIALGDHDDFVAASSMSASERTAALTAAGELVAWFRRVFDAPDAPEEDAWAPSYLEYQMSVAADGALEGHQTVLDAEEYHHGHLDWYSFDIREAGPEDGLPDLEPGLVPRRPPQLSEPLAFIPTPVEFAGMPNLRWWQLEDQQTDFGSLNAGTTDVALLMLAEFGLVYGNDWSLVPYDLEVGSLARVTGLVVTDSFGERTLVRAAGRGRRRRLAAMGPLPPQRRSDGPPDDRLFLAPALARSEGGSPIEEVVLARDEVANMVWGIEAVIPGVRGDGTNGFEAATALTAYLARTQPAARRTATGRDRRRDPLRARHDGPGELDPLHRHRTSQGRTARSGSSGRRCRGSPRRELSDVVEPRGVLLRDGLDAGERYFVHEEEVPRGGAVVGAGVPAERGGATVGSSTWLGRRKTTGRGPGASGLRFDRTEARS